MLEPNDHENRTERLIVRKLARTSCVVVGAVMLAGCTVSCTGSGISGPPPPVAPIAPAPDIGAFLLPNYRVTLSFSAPLEALPRPADIVVVSAGPGSDVTQPVQGGTQDVQVLSYDSVAKRWNLVFDAAQNVLDPSRLDTTEQTASGPQPLLPQSHMITDTTAQTAQLVSGTPHLVIYGVDDSTNHPAAILAVLDFSGGSATVSYVDSEVDMGHPTLSGVPGAQRLTVSAAFATPIDPACCPVRQYTQIIGSIANDHTSARDIGVIEDGRPWLGAWYATTPDHPDGPAIVVGTADNSPASSVLSVGDELIGVADTTLPNGDTYQPAVVDQIAVHRPSDQVTLQVKRHGQPMTFVVTLISRNSPAHSMVMPPAAGLLGVQAQDAPTGSPPGALVERVDSGSAGVQAGLNSGDVIIAAGSVAVTSLADLQVALMGQAGRSLALRVVRADGSIRTLSERRSQLGAVTQ